MDPDRVRAYLQISCAGLGFDIGELWWTSNKDGGSTSALATIEEKKDSNGASSDNRGKKLRFVQLYTSKSYENRRPMLIRPTEEDENSEANGSASEDSSSDLEKHVLSPTMVDAISKTAQVVWAHTKKTEGLTGKSDIRLQTAVGMPVAVDKDGNMCVVVMFSPKNIQSTDNALEYLQSISRSATSTSIPCLLPAFDPKQGLISLQHHHHHSSINEALPQLSNVLTDDVITRFVPLDENSTENNNSPFSIPEVHSDHDLESAPRDCFGIPMLPAIAELGNSRRADLKSDATNDAFDEASYGVWSTIMQSLDETDSTLLTEQQETRASINANSISINSAFNNQICTTDKPVMGIETQERLEEFASAFLDVSIFDLAEVWIPAGQNSDFLNLNSSVKSIDNNKSLDEFCRESERTLIQFWSGAVGRAYSSGNPVWSFKKDIFSDSGRERLFREAKIETVFAVPVFSGKSKTPAFVFCCYSFVRSGSIPFVLKFVQQALKLLWSGLDSVEPHESVDEDEWKHVAPADLGEMAADVEMHQHFLIKKRPIGAISTELDSRDESIKTLTTQVGSLESASGATSMPSIYTGQGGMENSSPQQVQRHTYEGIQSQIKDAIKSVADMRPAHHHIATNANGSKRAHILLQEAHTTYELQPQQQQPYEQQQLQPRLLQEGHYETIDNHARGMMSNDSSPLPLPQPLRLPNQFVHPVNNEHSASNSQETQMHYQSLRQQIQPQAIDNSPQNQLGDYNFNINKAYSFSTMQQQQPNHQEQVPVPTPVFSSPMDALNATGTIASAPPTAFNPQNNVRMGHTGSVATSRASSGRSTASNTKSCRIQGCDDAALARRPYCVRHSGNRMCEHKGCGKCAQGSTRFCIAHGGGRRCTFPGCDKGARDKFFCAAHGGGKRCKFDGCIKSAVGGSNLCTAHGGGRRCSVDGCDKSAQSSTKFCVKHGGGKKCSFAGCEKVSRGRTQYCAAHGGGVRCKLAGCNRVAIGKVQLCRAHGGGARPKQGTFSGREVRLPGSIQGTFCVPIIEPVMDGYDRQQQHQRHQGAGTDLANI